MSLYSRLDGVFHEKRHSFLANIILLVCASFGLSGLLLAPPYKRIGHMARDPQYYDGYERQTEGERHLEMLKVRAEQRKALTDRKAETEKRKAQLVNAKKFFVDNGKTDAKTFKDKFEELYRKKKVTIADGVPYSFDASDINQFVHLFATSDKEFKEAVRVLKERITTERVELLHQINAIKVELRKDLTRSDVRPYHAQELSKAEHRVEKFNIYILLLERATDKNTLRALLGLQKDVEAPDEELERLYQAVQGVQQDADYAKFKEEKDAALAKEIDQQEALLKEMENYDSVQNVLFRAFLPDEFDGVSATTVPGKIGLALAIPFVTSVRKSLDSEYEKITNRFVRYFGECFHDFMVAVGVASPLSAKKVASWSRMVTSYKKSMDNLAKGSSDSTDVAAAFGARAANRPEKAGHQIAPETTPNSDLASQVNEEGEVDDVTDFIRHADPVYVRVSADFVRQMRRQISLVFRRMSGDSYVEQREVLSDILKMLDCVGYLATGSFKVYRQSGLTQVLNRDISACCEWLSAQLAMLKDLIDSEAAEEPATSSSSSSYGAKGGRLGVDY